MFLRAFYYQTYLVLRADTSKDGRRADGPNGGFQQLHPLRCTSAGAQMCKTGVRTGVRKAGCCVCSFKDFFSSIPLRATFKRRSMRRETYSQQRGILPGRKIWARAPFLYESTYRGGLLAGLLRIMVHAGRNGMARWKPQKTVERRSFTMWYH